MIIYQNTDDSQLKFVLANDRLKEFAKGHQLVFMHSGSDPRFRDLRLAYPDADVRACENNQVDKARKFIEYWRLGLWGRQTVVRQCSDAVVMNPEQLMDFIAETSSEKPEILGSPNVNPGALQWIRGATQVWTPGLLDIIDVPVGRSYEHDQLVFKACMACGAAVLQRPVVKLGYYWDGSAPVWHPCRLGFKSDLKETI